MSSSSSTEQQTKHFQNHTRRQSSRQNALAARFSTTADQKLPAFSGDDTNRLVDSKTFNPLPVVRLNEWITGGAISPNGKPLACVTHSGTQHVRPVAGDVPAWQLPLNLSADELQESVWNDLVISFSPNARYVLVRTSGSRGRVRQSLFSVWYNKR